MLKTLHARLRQGYRTGTVPKTSTLLEGLLRMTGRAK